MRRVLATRPARAATLAGIVTASAGTVAVTLTAGARAGVIVGAVLFGTALTVVTKAVIETLTGERQRVDAQAVTIDERNAEHIAELRRALEDARQQLATIEARLDELGQRDDDLTVELRDTSEELTRTVVSLHAHVTGWAAVDE